MSSSFFNPLSNVPKPDVSCLFEEGLVYGKAMTERFEK